MESCSSEYVPESSDLKKLLGATADTEIYTCTYYGCTLRFDTPAKLQKHKREGHRNSAVIGAGDERKSQAGPHKVSHNSYFIIISAVVRLQSGPYLSTHKY